MRFPRAQALHPYNIIDNVMAGKKCHFILSETSDFQMINNLSIPIKAFLMRMLLSLYRGDIAAEIMLTGLSSEACHLKWKWLLLVYNTWTISYLRYLRAQCFRLITSGYAVAWILLQQVYLLDPQDHLRSLRLPLFLQNIVYFFSFLMRKKFLLFDLLMFLVRNLHRL